MYLNLVVTFELHTRRKICWLNGQPKPSQEIQHYSCIHLYTTVHSKNKVIIYIKTLTFLHVSEINSHFQGKVNTKRYATLKHRNQESF